jgi:3-dehydroquinate synthetase
MDYVSIPTTVVGQLDAAIGGKTAINLGGTKNVLGAFHLPRMVICERLFLSTLDQTAFRDGLVEGLKVFAGCDQESFDRYAPRLPVGPGDTRFASFLERAVKAKVAVVNRDPFDRGFRNVLNLGHTTGHALEASLRVSHGRAVAFGILVATELSLTHCRLSRRAGERLRSAILSIYRRPAEKIPKPPQLWRNILQDKKKSGNQINFTLLRQIGRHVVKPVSYDQFAQALNHLAERVKR